jgi:hypothetical protein
VRTCVGRSGTSPKRAVHEVINVWLTTCVATTRTASVLTSRRAGFM